MTSLVEKVLGCSQTFPYSGVPIQAVIVSIAITTTLHADEISYNRDIRPLLSDRCFACHGPDANHRKADLRLDVEGIAKKEAVVPGEPGASELIARITSDAPELQMPPPDSGKSLNDEEIELLRRWISEGAKYEPFWAYIPPKKHALPKVQRNDWPTNWIDNFILARLESEGLSPANDADNVTLIRRLSFDLTGLPPSPEEVAAFYSTTNDAAYEKLVDRLLESEHFGERMAVYWLDLVRYADTVGYHGDQDHAAWPYRDYVIRAFNSNKPFDDFTREQLAGDLLPNPSIEQKIATAYNRLLQTSHEGGVQEKEYLAIYAADRIRNFSNVWMGATLGCAQCHDHKYDPYTARDFYSMVAFFADVDENAHLNPVRRRGLAFDAVPTPRPPELDLPTEEQQKNIADLEAQIAVLKAKESKDKQVVVALKKLEGQLKALRREVTRVMVTVSTEPRTIRILPRGDWLAENGEVVQPAFPEFLAHRSPLSQRSVDEARLTRLGLANWLVDPEEGVGGLTARVFVNRFWYLLFGMGISKSLDDFGGQGEAPTHPRLLDNLAVEFYESGWDIKAVVKRIVMSRAYRQSSVASPELRTKDPYNRLYARQSSFRLPAEMVRDNVLAISGLMVHQVGGESVKPYQPTGYYRHLNFPRRTYQSHTDERQWRRGVYIHWQRQFLHPMLKAFDAPSREECTAERPHSNTPLAALILLNDPTFVEAARNFAARIMQHGGHSDTERLNYAFRHAISRDADKFEQQVLQNFLTEQRQAFKTEPAKAEQLIAIGNSPVSDKVDHGELASWTSVARAILNLNETMTRN